MYARPSFCGRYHFQRYSISSPLRSVGAAARPSRRSARGQRQQHVPAGERQAKETPGRLVTAHDADALAAVRSGRPARRGSLSGPEQSVGPGPEFPFDAGVIDAEPGVPQHRQRDHDEARQISTLREAPYPQPSQQQGGERHRRSKRRSAARGRAGTAAGRRRIGRTESRRWPSQAEQRDRRRHRRASARLKSSAMCLHIRVDVANVDRRQCATMIRPVKPLWRNW